MPQYYTAAWADTGVLSRLRATNSKHHVDMFAGYVELLHPLRHFVNRHAGDEVLENDRHRPWGCHAFLQGVAAFQAARDVTVLSECGVDLGEPNLQLIANVENQDRAQCGKNEAGGMISVVPRARKHVGKGAPEDGSKNPDPEGPENLNVPGL